MTDAQTVHPFAGRLVMLGFGCIGQGMLPLLLRHLGMQPGQVTIVKPHARGLDAAQAAGVNSLVQALAPGNFATVLTPLLGPGDFLLNLSVNVSSVVLLHWCRDAGVLYLDTCIERWAGTFADPALSASQRSNHALREAALALRRDGVAPTSVLTHGANPGLASHFVKQALLNIAADTGTPTSAPATREAWAEAATRVRSWTPRGGPMHGFLVTHAESISIARYFTLGQGRTPDYRPTMHYAYHPCDDAVLSLHELAGCEWRMQPRWRLLRDDIASGIDELGVLLMGLRHGSCGAYWYGSQLSIDEARALAPDNNATSLQVVAGVLAGIVWALRNPARGIVEPDEMAFDEVLSIAAPYLGPMTGAWTDWTPLADRGRLFEDDVDPSDPWQFKNIRVT